MESHATAILSPLDANPLHTVNGAVVRIHEACGVERKPTQVRRIHKIMPREV
ncbi:MAG: hypothetical protein ACI358_07735 [Candidatus Limimorpha sp.]